jgi:hypothetical protein
MMVGFVTPVILLPKIEFSANELTFVLKHELVHYKRKDLWYKLLVMLVSAVHWFNPIVQLMASSVLNLCEISCDEAVLSGADEKSRACYGETIIGVIRKGRYCETALSTNFYSGKRGIKERVHAIMDQKKKRFSFGAILIAAAVTLCAITAFVLSSPQKKAHKVNSSSKINSSMYETEKLSATTVGTIGNPNGGTEGVNHGLTEKGSCIVTVNGNISKVVICGNGSYPGRTYAIIANGKSNGTAKTKK